MNRRQIRYRLFVVGAAVWALHSGVVLAQETDAPGDVAAHTEVVVSDYHPLFEAAAFYLFGGLAVVSALAICVSRDIVRMAVWLFATLSSVAVLYFLLAAYFVGAVQLIVYAGGTLVLLIFGVMLTNKSPWVRLEVRRGEMILGALVAGLLVLALLGVVLETQWLTTAPAEPAAMATLGKELLTTYLVPFEAASVLLLVVMIGAAYLARQERE
ncbi:MAG: NADH-quinone oxidoreductase subunit J [Phycisphaerae bacterium]